MKSITAMELQELPLSFLSSNISNCNLIRLQFLIGSCRELTSPKLGRDFVAGILEDGKSFGVFRKSVLRSVEFARLSEPIAPVIEYTSKTIGELIAGQLFPTRAKLRYLEPEPKDQNIKLFGVARGFLFTDLVQHPAIPIAALGSIELDCE